MRPYLSFVVAARNDNYGGDFLHRMQGFVNVLLPLLGNFKLESELLVVEWNPPQDRVRLREALDWLRCPDTVVVRIIEVPTKIHRSRPNSDKMPMFDCFAKNVGIRRARGEFVLVTNPDVLFSQELVAYLAAKRLSKNRFYRMDRYDFRGSVPLESSPQDALRYAKKNIYLVNIRGDNRTGLSIPIGRAQKWYCLLFGKWPGSYDGYRNGGESREPVVSLNDDNGVFGGVYTNASGDFLLASFESWNQIRGFPEFTDTFTHLDSYGCHQLKALGLEQTLFLPPLMMMHGDHSREEQKSRPRISSEKVENDLKNIRAGLLGPAINGEDWGLANQDLSETVALGEIGSK